MYSYLKNYENTEDAMQTVYLKVKLGIGQYIHGTNGRAWLLLIAKNQAINELNKDMQHGKDFAVPIVPKISGGVTEVMRKVL